jgi:hypothetical protein
MHLGIGCLYGLIGSIALYKQMKWNQFLDMEIHALVKNEYFVTGFYGRSFIHLQKNKIKS